MNKKWIAKACELYKQGKKYYQIGNELGIDRKAVSRELRALSYKSDERYVRNVNPNKLRKYDYSYAENIFEKIDTEEKAYWLGFLYADGYVSNTNISVSLSLAEEGIEHVKKFRSFFKMENKKLSKKKKVNDGKIYYSYEFSVCSSKIKSDLTRLGCGNCKTFMITFPSDDIVPEEFKKDFVRGYIDGDGCITKSQTSCVTLDIVGTESFLDGYQKWTGLKYNKLHALQNTTILHSMYSGFAAIIILDRIYKNATIYLDRKYSTYLALRRLRMSSVKRPKSIIAELSVEGDLTPNTTLKTLLKEAAMIR